MRDVVPRVKRETLSDWRQCVYQPFIFHVAEIYCAWRKKKKEEKKEEKYHMDYAIEWIFALSIRDYIWRNIERARESYIYMQNYIKGA